MHRSHPQRLEVGEELKRKILERSTCPGVIGLGYVGLPLAVEMARAGFQVTGIDIDKRRVESVNGGISYVLDVPGETLRSFVKAGTIQATQSLETIRDLDTDAIASAVIPVIEDVAGDE